MLSLERLQDEPWACYDETLTLLLLWGELFYKVAL